MTTELTQPPSDSGQAQASAPGQSQDHRRRRRRRRKTKSNPAAQSQPQNGQAAAPQPAAPPPPIQQNQPRPNGQPQGQGGSGRKKKKKPHQGFQASPGNNANPGNSINGNGGSKKRQQKGPRQFVGPMDHSYRVVNGNVADSPPSTIPLHGGSNGNSGGYYSDLQSGRIASPPVAAADSPTRIFFFIEDLFFLAKIQEVARKLGVKVEFVKADKEVLARITDAPENERPGLLVFDLNNASTKPLTLIPKLRTKLKKSVSIIGFLSHLQGDLKMKAIEAGCDTVMPRSAFSQSLPNLIMRYGANEEEDNYRQPV